MENQNIDKLSITELKALKCDILESMEIAKLNIQTLNMRIAELQRIAVPKVETTGNGQ
jgi:hypothetical protein